MFRTATTAALLLASSSVYAAEPVKIDFTQPVLDLTDKPMHETADEKSPLLTLGLVASSALQKLPAQDSRSMPAEHDVIKLAKRALLAQKVQEGKEVELTAEQVSEIKGAVAIFGPVIVLRVIQAVDPAALK